MQKMLMRRHQPEKIKHAVMAVGTRYKMNENCFSCENCLHNHNDGEGCAIHHDMEPCDDWSEKVVKE